MDLAGTKTNPVKCGVSVYFAYASFVLAGGLLVGAATSSHASKAAPEAQGHVIQTVSHQLVR
ncbi:MAG: hypothetical protein AAFR60_07645 [Pseudomonadota bacterium]